MSCQFKNIKVSAQGPLGSAPDIEISGEAVNCGCDQLAITVIGCDNRRGSRPTINVKPDSSGKFKAKFEQANVPFATLECTCGGDITFGISCLDATGKVTHQQQYTYKIECKPPCPTITFKELSNTCNPDGKREITIEATVDNTTSSTAVYQWLHNTTNGIGGTSGPVFTVPKGAKSTQTQKFTFKADGKDHEVTIKTVLPSGCGPDTKTIKVNPCPVPDKCPKVTNKIKVTQGTCKPNQKLDVTLEAELTQGAASKIDYQWQFGTDYSPAQTLTFSKKVETVTYTFKDVPGDGKPKDAKLIIINPKGCKMDKGDTTVTTTVCKNNCPSISVKAIPEETCENGKRKVNFKITGTMPAGASGTIALNDITDAQNIFEIGKNNQSSGTIDFTLSRIYSPGEYKAKLKIVSQTGCPIHTFEKFTVKPCPGNECPKTAYKTTVADKCDKDGNREVNIEAKVSPQSIGKVTAKLINTADPSTVLDEKKDQTGVFTLSHKKSYKGGTKQEFKVIFSNSNTCKAKAETVNVPACPKPPTGEPPVTTTPEEGGGCIVSRIIAVIAVSTAIISFLLIICFPAAVKLLVILGIAFTAVAVLLLVLYGAFCNPKPCKWWLLIIGQTLIGTGLFGAWLSNCCPLMLYVGIFATLAGILLLVLWKALCKLPWCQWGKEILYVMAGIIAPIISFIALVPVLNNCLSGIAGGIVTGVTLVLGVLGIATCISNTSKSGTKGKP